MDANTARIMFGFLAGVGVTRFQRPLSQGTTNAKSRMYASFAVISKQMLPAMPVKTRVDTDSSYAKSLGVPISAHARPLLCCVCAWPLLSLPRPRRSSAGRAAAAAPPILPPFSLDT